ncbi:hypothetical protein BDQ17DRAFT_1423213 [Cyathus striatus]|nr:hypothetical protein BDQ17DRAFT_1423213 [Cyathus striatus]
MFYHPLVSVSQELQKWKGFIGTYESAVSHCHAILKKPIYAGAHWGSLAVLTLSDYNNATHCYHDQSQFMDIDQDGSCGPSNSTGPFVVEFSDAAKIYGTEPTFMDSFDNDKFAEYRSENLYYPFASHAEWEVAEFLLNLELSMAQIDVFLKLEMENLEKGATLLGTVLSSDKTTISALTGNCVAHPLLISLANIDMEFHNKSSNNLFILLALLPIPRYIHPKRRFCGVLENRLIHACLGFILEPLKKAAQLGCMMSDPVGNVQYCYTPLAAYIVDTPEAAMLAGVGGKTSPLTMAYYK